MPRLTGLAQGGTAVGTGINAHPKFGAEFAAVLAKQTGIDFHPADDYFEALSSQDTAVELSGQLKTTAVSLMKIANDLRWMNSGPLAGLAEIALPALQPGSSIMPGKVNPVIPEAVAMVAAQVIGNDATITIAGQSGNFQLNVMLPVVALNLLQSIELLANAVVGARRLRDQGLQGQPGEARRRARAQSDPRDGAELRSSATRRAPRSRSRRTRKAARSATSRPSRRSSSRSSCASCSIRSSSRRVESKVKTLDVIRRRLAAPRAPRDPRARLLGNIDGPISPALREMLDRPGRPASVLLALLERPSGPDGAVHGARRRI